MADKALRDLVILHDADWLVHNASSAVTKVIEWEDGILEAYADLDEAKQVFLGWVNRIHGARKAWADAVPIMTFTDAVNWRKTILPTYKSNRAGTAKPLAYWKLKEWVQENYECFQRPTLEGDDCMGILSTAPRLVQAKKAIIASPDKDFNTIPGEFFWIDTYGNKHEFKVVSEKEADEWHMLQTLMGDATDGYTGCPGIGETVAREFLKEPYMVYQEERILKSGPRKGESDFIWKKRALNPDETLWDAVVALFVKAGFDEEYALTQARVARICRATDFNLKTKEVIPWTPESNKGG